MRKSFTATLFLALMTFSTCAFADFYVIAAGKRAMRTVLVSPKNTRAESGAALLAALAKITDASETKPYLVVIEPGIFDVGNTALEMKAYVDIQGSGQSKTTIQGNVSGDATGLVVSAHLAELRHVTLKNWGTSGHVAALHNEAPLFSILYVTAEARGGAVNYGVRNLTSSKMSNVTALAAGFSGTNYAVYNQNASPTLSNVSATASGWSGTTNIGIYNLYASPSMNQVTVKASGGDNTYGIWNAFSSPVLNQVSATASNGLHSNIGIQLIDGQATLNHSNVSASGGSVSYGIYGDSHFSPLTVRVNHSILSGGANSVQMRSLSTCFIGNTQLIGGVGGTGSIKCAGVYDGNYNFYASTCP